MKPDLFFAEASLAVSLQLFAAGIGMVAAIVCGVFLVQRKRLPTALTVAPVALPSLVGAAVALYSAGAVASGDLDATLQGAAWAVGGRGGAVLFTLPIASLYLLILATAGARDAPRRVAWAAGMAVAVLIVVGVTWQKGWNEDYAPVRALFYLVLGLPLCVAMLSGDPDNSAGPEAAATGGLVFAVAVATAETSERALMSMFLIFPLATVSSGKRGEYLDISYGEVDEMLLWESVSMGLGAVVGVLAVACAISADRKRALQALSGLIWLAWIPAFNLLGSLDRADVERIAGMLPEPPAAEALDEPQD